MTLDNGSLVYLFLLKFGRQDFMNIEANIRNITAEKTNCNRGRGYLKKNRFNKNYFYLLSPPWDTEAGGLLGYDLPPSLTLEVPCAISSQGQRQVEERQSPFIPQPAREGGVSLLGSSEALPHAFPG